MTLFGWLPRPEKPLRRKPSVRWRRMPDGVALIDETEGQLVHFNPVGDRVWEELDGVKDAAALARLLTDEFDASERVLARDIRGFLRGLRRRELVEEAR